MSAASAPVARLLVGTLRSPWPWLTAATLVAVAALVGVGIATLGELTSGPWGWFGDKLRIPLAIGTGVTFVPLVHLAVANGTTRRDAVDGLLRGGAVLGAAVVAAVVAPYVLEWGVFGRDPGVLTRVASPGDVVVAFLAGTGLAGGFAVTGAAVAAACVRSGLGPRLLVPGVVALLPAVVVEAAWSLVLRAEPFPGLLFSALLTRVPLDGPAAVAVATTVSGVAVAGGVAWLRRTTSSLPLHGGPLRPRETGDAPAVDLRTVPFAAPRVRFTAAARSPRGPAAATPVRRAATTIVRELGAPWFWWYAVGLAVLTVAVTIGIEVLGELETGVWGWVVNHLRFAAAVVGMCLGGALRWCVANGVTRRDGVRGLLLGLGIGAVAVAAVAAVGYAVEGVAITALGTATPELDAVGVLLAVPFGALLLAAYLLTGWLIALGFQRFGAGVGLVTLVPALLPAALVEGVLGAGFDLPADLLMLTAVALPWPAGGAGAALAVVAAVSVVAAGVVAVVVATRRLPLR